MVCGVILMGSVVTPISDHYEHEMDGCYQEIADRDAALIDSYLESNADEIYLHGETFLPDPSFSLRVSGYRVTLEDGYGKCYESYLRQPAQDLILSYGSTVILLESNEISLEEETPIETQVETE